MLEETLDRLVIEPDDGRTYHLCADKGYDYEVTRDAVRERGYRDHVRSRGEEKRDKASCRHRPRRWVVERTHSWFNRFRRLFIRWEKKARNYEAMLHFACAMIAFRAAEVLG